jgi:hypothetical protein
MNHISYSPWLLPLSKKTVLGSFVKAAPVSQNQEFTCSEDHYYYLLIRSSCYRIRRSKYPGHHPSDPYSWRSPGPPYVSVPLLAAGGHKYAVCQEPPPPRAPGRRHRTGAVCGAGRPEGAHHAVRGTAGQLALVHYITLHGPAPARHCKNLARLFSVGF